MKNKIFSRSLVALAIIGVIFILFHTINYVVGTQSGDRTREFNGDNRDASRTNDYYSPKKIREESHADKLKRLKLAADSSIEKQELAKKIEDRKKPDSFLLFSESDGQLTTGAVEAVKLSELERKEVEQLISETWTVASQDFASRAVLDKVNTDEKNGLYFYNIPAREDRGKEPLEELENSMRKIVGKQRQEILTGAIGSYDCYGKFGSLGIRLEFDMNSRTYKYTYTDPKSGGEKYFGEGMLDQFRLQFGDAFEIGE